MSLPACARAQAGCRASAGGPGWRGWRASGYPEKFAAHRSRNNQILLAALAQIQPQVDDAIAKYGRERDVRSTPACMGTR
ncbi:hypothetical protein ECZU29_21340 [Escherichia coli]|nr:hypothetical protein ECZU29_21340 [Escherichia coli]